MAEDNLAPNTVGSKFSPVAAGISAAASLAQIPMTFLQRSWNKSDYRQQVQDNISQWQRQNEYNSPAAQMARYRAAGLNPNLIYGQSNASGDAQVAPSLASTPNMAASFGSVADAMRQTAMTDAQIDLLRANAEKARSDAEHNAHDIRIRDYINQQGDEKLRQGWESLSQRQQEIVEQQARNIHLNELDDAKRAQLADLLLSQAQERQEMQARIEQLNAETDYKKKLADLQKLEIQFFNKTRNAQIQMWKDIGYGAERSGYAAYMDANTRRAEFNKTIEYRQRLIEAQTDSEYAKQQNYAELAELYESQMFRNYVGAGLLEGALTVGSWFAPSPLGKVGKLAKRGAQGAKGVASAAQRAREAKRAQRELRKNLQDIGVDLKKGKVSHNKTSSGFGSGSGRGFQTRMDLGDASRNTTHNTSPWFDARRGIFY